MAKRSDLVLKRAYENLDFDKQSKIDQIPAVLGFLLGGIKTVEVDGRPGYVYARIRSNLNELVQVFNDKVSPVYDLPVILIRDPNNPTRYKVDGRDVGRYENWGSVSSYLPRHGNQHSFNIDAGGGGDIVWTYREQMMPLLVQPSGTSGAGSVQINQTIVYDNNTWQVLGGTGTVSLLPAKPTDSQARMMLIGLDNDGNPWIVTGSFFAGTITGSVAVTQYLPDPLDGIVLGAVRLVSGSNALGWSNIYDLRHFFDVDPGSSVAIFDSGVQQTLNVTQIDFNDNLSVVVSGSQVWINGSAGGGGGGGSLGIYEDGVFQVSGTAIDFRDELVIVSGSSAYIERPTWSQHHFEDEFLGGNEGDQAGNMNWRFVTGNIDGQLGEYNHPGIVTLDHNAAQTLYMILSTPAGGGALNTIDVNDVEYLGAIVRPTTTITGSSCTFKFGLVKDLGLTSNENDSSGGGVYWSFYAPVDPDYWGSVTRRSSKTRNTTTVPYISGTWVLLEIFRRDFDQWDFYINDTYHATHTANVPSGTAFLGFSFPTSSQQNELDVDWFGMRTRKFTQRWT